MNFKNIFSIQCHSDDFRLIRQLNLINFFFIIEIVVFNAFAVINFLRPDKYNIALFDLLSGLIFITAFIDLRINKVFSRSKWIATISLLLFLIFFSEINQNDSFGLVWTVIAPIVFITIHGHKEGLRISLMYAFTLLLLACMGVGEWQGGAWNYISLMRLSAAMSIVILISYLGERSIDKFQKSLNELSVTDHLTKLYNRRKIDEILLSEMQTTQRYGIPLSIILLDIDFFKQINDERGHLDGDKILIELSKYLKNELRISDSIGRWGGEEFLIIQPHTNEKDSFLFAERLRIGIKEHFKETLHITCSFGVCEYSALNNSMHRLLSCADKALYRAKESGRDRVCCHELSDQ